MPKKDDSQLVEEWERVTAEYDAAKAIFDATAKDSPEREVARRRWEQAQRGVQEARSYWRSIGEGVAVADPTHPGARASIVTISDNDGSAA